MKKINHIEASRTNWLQTVQDDDSDFPGIDYIKMGCLQRIANATEAMSKNHTRLIEEKEYFERRYKSTDAENDRLRRSNAALRGVINRMKKEAHNG